MISLSIYVSVAIIYDFLLSNNGVASGKFPATITAIFTAGAQVFFTCKNFEILNRLFRLSLLKSNYSFWAMERISYKDKTKSSFDFKAKLCFSQWLNLFALTFFVFLGSVFEAKNWSSEYYFNKWFGVAGILVIPAVRLFTTFIYVPNWTYKLFFRI
ncbi:hypothetical protein [Mycoplasma parvum]|uniref:Uncharacterized protein n=1 Tax=Mycoplasma parvum str. Indiana TaxID=1403316 RepID=U5NBS0_9MOLU|nr:hypothetical protein [Mycoplasma parvum]AGX89011.1 hypothetical protein PRV_01245 [Mycoplasma parvum str. Indiana]